MDFVQVSQNALPTLTVILMGVALVVSIIPIVPGPALLWTIGVVFAVLTDFERVGLPPLIIMTGFMVLGSTTDVWLTALGMRASGGSCLTSVGTLVGGLIGTFAIAIPVVGTLIGALIGALAVEFLRIREIRAAIKAGKSAIRMYLISLVVEFILTIGIFVTFALSIWLTR